MNGKVPLINPKLIIRVGGFLVKWFEKEKYTRDSDISIFPHLVLVEYLHN